MLERTGLGCSFLMLIALRQLTFPNGLIVLLCTAAVAFWQPLPSSAARVLAIAIIVAAALLAVRLRSLRAFMSSTALAGMMLAASIVAVTPDYVMKVVAAILVIDFALMVLVDDAFFDWDAVGWWAALQLVQWVGFAGLLQWAPGTLRDVAERRFDLGLFQISTLEVLFCACALFLFGRFLLTPDAIGAGLLWGSAPLLMLIHRGGSYEPLMAVSGLAIAIAVIERSHWVAYHDELTGLPGRRAFNEKLASLGDAYCIAMVDVDHFKKFNDTYGHDTGDQVLRKVAGCLAHVRGGGSSYRCGGEEFAMVFPGLDLAEAGVCSEEMRSAIEAESFVVRGPDRSTRKREDRRQTGTKRKPPAAVKTHVTVSIGVAQATSQVHDVRAIVEAADQALYKAKELGRNRVEFAPLRRPAARKTKAVAKAAPLSRQP
jgi:diguanylate cyclase (GGDEF)-like protein